MPKETSTFSHSTFELLFSTLSDKPCSSAHFRHFLFMSSSVVDTTHASYDRVMNRHEVLVTPLSHQLLLRAVLLCSAFCDVPCVVIFSRRTEAVIMCVL